MTGIGYSPALMQRLAARELPMDTLALAKFLVGKILIREFPEGIAGGRIVEAEAYPPGDEACHAYRGLTARNRPLFLERGHIYVYRIYGKSLLLNISSESQDVGAGVLLRAIEPMFGLSLMQRHRPAAPMAALARGPGNLGAALQISLNMNGLLIGDPPLRLLSDGLMPETAAARRIGIRKNADMLWRYYMRGSRYVSGPRSIVTAGHGNGE